MSAFTAVAIASTVKIEIFSVHFNFPGGQAISLRDPVTGQHIGATPEWITGSRSELAGYVRGTRPHLSVVFRAGSAMDGQYVIGANGIQFDVEEQRATLVFDALTGLSAPVVVRAAGQLPNTIGLRTVVLNWYVRENANIVPAGTSSHNIATSWRATGSAPATEMGLPDWVYRPFMEWTCAWAADRTDEKSICDAIISNVIKSGLRYGVRARDVRDLLIKGGGMCGVWYQAFQQMAHCQGVFVYRRRFLVDWRKNADNEEHWCAIVIRSGGLNQSTATHAPSNFHDNDSAFPIPAGTVVPITDRHEARYRFWGFPNLAADGHCINFLVYNHQVYLYDACFGIGPIQINAAVPLNDTNVAQGGTDLAPFKTAYLDKAIDYMLGSIRNGLVFFQSIRYLQINGMTVRTIDIPPKMNGIDGLTFRWGN